MRSHILAPAAMLCLLSTFTSNILATECCECGTTHKLKKVYRAVVTFKPVKATMYDYCTECQDVLAPTTTCVKGCGQGCGCGETVGCECGAACGESCGCDDIVISDCEPSGQSVKKCAWFGPPKTITVPVAVQKKRCTYTRLVPCVTWVVECKCVECCKECDDHHCCFDCLH